MAVDQSLSETRLNDETLSELGLTTQPFVENKKQTRFSDSASQKIRASLEQKLRFGQSVHLLTGEQGVGKSVFLSQLFKHCKNNLKPFVAKGDDHFSARAFLAAVQYQLSGESEEYDSIHDYIDALIPQFEKLSAEKMGAVLTIDDAHNAPIEEVAELVNLMPAFITEGDEVTARLLLAGEPQLVDELSAIAEEFDEGVYDPTHTTLPALDETRIRDYLSSRLKQAGFTDTFPFTDKSIAKIYRESAGLPGRINTAATRYLNQVYAAAPAKAGGAGILSALGWPLVALGTAAVGLIAWGLSMFFTGDAPEPIVNIEPTPTVVENTESEQVATATTTNPVTLPLLQSDQQTANASAGTKPDTGAKDTLAAGQDDSSQPDSSDNLLKPEDQPVAMSGDNTSAVSDTLTNTTTQVKETVTQIVEAPDDNSSQDNLNGAVTAVSDTGSNAIDAGAELLDTVNTTVSQRAEQISAEAQRDGITVAEDSVSAAEDRITTTEQTEQLAQSIGQGTAQALPESVEVIIPGAANTAAVDTLTNSDDTDAAAITIESEAVGVAVPVQPTPPAAPSALTDDNGVALNVDSVDAAPAISRAVENERWVLFQDAAKFTVQLATSRERGYIIDLAQTLPASDPVAIYPFLTTSSKNPVFGLLSGLYNTRQEALDAVENMDPGAKQFGTWIRPIGDLQADIKAGN